MRSRGGWEILRKIIKMGPRASKINLDSTILGGFDIKIMFLMSVCVRNLTFHRFLAILGNFQKLKKKHFVKIDKQIVLSRSNIGKMCFLRGGNGKDFFVR